MASVSFKRSNRAVWAGQIEDRHVRLVGMTFQPFRMAVQHSEAEYGWQVTEEGLSYQARQKDRVHFLDFPVDLAAGSLAVHLQSQDRVGRRPQWENTPPPT